MTYDHRQEVGSLRERATVLRRQAAVAVASGRVEKTRGDLEAIEMSLLTRELLPAVGEVRELPDDATLRDEIDAMVERGLVVVLRGGGSRSVYRRAQWEPRP